MQRGKVGRIHSWVPHHEECSDFVGGVRILKHLPAVVFVKFVKKNGKDVPWTLDGLEEPGLYPIVPRKGCFYLDKGRMHPVLQIRRQQLPLAPAFATTSHAAQGQTFSQGVVVDLCLSKGSNIMSSYVSMTRVRNRQSLLIYRPFPRELFARGIAEGPSILLKLLRGEHVDWKALGDKYAPKAFCTGCRILLLKKDYALQQWNIKNKKPYCKACGQQNVDGETPFQFNVCFKWKATGAFLERFRSIKSINVRVCESCTEKRVCSECTQAKTEEQFLASQWARAGWQPGLDGRCKECVRHHMVKKNCSGCKESKTESEFNSRRQWMASDTARRKGCQTKSPGHWLCKPCAQKNGRQEMKPQSELSKWLAETKLNK